MNQTKSNSSLQDTFASDREDREIELANFGPLELLILQPTSYCNLNCDYCYLPDRHLKNTLSLDLIEPIFKNIFASPFVKGDFTVCWHAGEPLAVSISFYETALAKIEELDRQLNVDRYQIINSIQTNATLINPAWCDLFKKYQVRVGVSIDGPAFIHDAHRRTRTGVSTHASTMRGIEHLRKNDIDICVIAVITQESLDYPDEIFNFFMENDITDVGFNIEELEGVNHSSSLQKSGSEERYRNFMKRFWELTVRSEGAFKLREFENLGSLVYGNERVTRNQVLRPFAIISIDNQGNFSTFDPELLGVKTDPYGDFTFGNVLKNSFESVCHTQKFQRIYSDIKAGIELCRDTCQYFGVCGGGASSNKYWENGTFRSSETMNCRYHQQTIADVVLEGLENSLGLKG
ncbi:MAG: cyclophane-forming radical SAM/SPASM peptide maturase GrrM/OscB [Prochloraceae cyanobacterium]|nr:cyclophane-forming radical SAM/SPASM peptide maturase GrrM/OscB [Prochloraceae cyanobacterium]